MSVSASHKCEVRKSWIERLDEVKELPNVLNKQQLILIFEAMDELPTFVASLLALFCGLRIAEVCSLKKRDVNLDNAKIHYNNP